MSWCMCETLQINVTDLVGTNRLSGGVKALFTRQHMHKNKDKTKEWSQACEMRIVISIRSRSWTKHKPRAKQKTKQRKILLMPFPSPRWVILCFFYVLILSLCLCCLCEPCLKGKKKQFYSTYINWENFPLSHCAMRVARILILWSHFTREVTRGVKISWFVILTFICKKRLIYSFIRHCLSNLAFNSLGFKFAHMSFICEDMQEFWSGLVFARTSTRKNTSPWLL